MSDRVKDEYELQRKLNLLLAQLPLPAQRTPKQVVELAKLQAEFRTLQGAAPEGGTGSWMGADTTGLVVAVELHMVQVPTGFAHLLDSSTPLVVYKVTNQRKEKVRVKLVTRVVGYSSDAIDTIEVAPGAAESVPHFPVFDYSSIADVTESRAASLHLRVEEIGGELERENSYRIVLLPRTTGYLAIRDASGGYIDLTPFLAAWITPNAPSVMRLIRDAAGHHADRSIVGYQPADAPNLDAIVTAQVAAIYAALQAYDLVYVNSVAAFNLAGDTFVQRVRLPRESLASKSANCIDGVVLMASALEAATLNPAIVLVPGHAFLAYELAPGSGNWDYVETTMIGTAPFADARAVGRSTAQEMKEAKPGEIQILPVAELRTKRGIFPME